MASAAVPQNEQVDESIASEDEVEQEAADIEMDEPAMPEEPLHTMPSVLQSAPETDLLTLI